MEHILFLTGFHKALGILIIIEKKTFASSEVRTYTQQNATSIRYRMAIN